ncbi:hypothetical protein NKH77_30890 [Streptomyces sp. M19]
MATAGRRPRSGRADRGARPPAADPRVRGGRGVRAPLGAGPAGGPVQPRPEARLPVPADQPGAAVAPDGSLAVVYRTPAAASPDVRIPGGSANRALRHFDGYGPVIAHTVPAPEPASPRCCCSAGPPTERSRSSTAPGPTPARSSPGG